MVQVLGELPEHAGEPLSPTITQPLGIGDTLQTVIGETGVWILQVLGALPEHALLL